MKRQGPGESKCLDQGGASGVEASAVFYIGFLYFRTQINSQINGNKFVCFRSSCVGKKLAQFACGLLELSFIGVWSFSRFVINTKARLLILEILTQGKHTAGTAFWVSSSFIFQMFFRNRNFTSYTVFR